MLGMEELCSVAEASNGMESTRKGLCCKFESTAEFLLFMFIERLLEGPSLPRNADAVKLLWAAKRNLGGRGFLGADGSRGVVGCGLLGGGIEGNGVERCFLSRRDI